MLTAKDNVEKDAQDVSTLVGCKNKLIGTQVVVETLEGEQYTGILKEVTDEFVITLSYAQKMPTSEESEFILCEGTVEKVLQLRNVVRLSGSIDEKKQCKAFRTDEEISAKNGAPLVKEDPELLPWSEDGEMLDDDSLLPEADGKSAIWEDGWQVEAMFEMNKDKVVGESTFDESLSQYSNVEVQPCTEEQIKRAEKIAKSIEANIESKRNALLENDDEERDLNTFTEFKLENHRPAEQLQQPQQQQQQRPQRKEMTGPRRVSGSNSMTSGKRWNDKRQPSLERSAEHSTTNWRSSNIHPSHQHHQRSHYGTKPHRSSSGYNPQQQSRPYQQQYHQTPYYKNAAGSRTSNYDVNTSQNLNAGRNRTEVTNEPRVVSSGSGAKPLAESVAVGNIVPLQYYQQQPHREEQTAQQIPPDPEIMGKEIKSEQGTEETEKEGRSSVVGEKAKETMKEGSESAEQQKEKFKLNPAAAPFIPKSKDLNTTSTAGTTNTSPLMSNPVPVPSFVQMSAIPSQGISTQNLVFYSQQAQTVVPAQISATAATYHQQPQTVVPAQIPSNSMSYHQPPAVVPAQISSAQVFYQQQPQTVVPAQLPSNPLYATYPIANSGQSILFVSPTAPNQAVILQPNVAQHFIPVSAAALSSQNHVGHHYRTVTPNGVNPQVPLPHPSTNLYPPPALHPAAQGMLIQSSPVQPLLNLAMPPNGVVPGAPPTSFHPTGRYHQQF